MNIKLLFIPFIALVFAATSVSAQTKEQVIDRYQQQKESIQASYKRDMDALNNQQNLTPAQRQMQKKQIIATYQQRKKANQQAFQDSKEALKTSARADKMDDHQNNKMKDKHTTKVKKQHPVKHHNAPKVKKAK